MARHIWAFVLALGLMLCAPACLPDDDDDSAADDDAVDDDQQPDDDAAPDDDADDDDALDDDSDDDSVDDDSADDDSADDDSADDDSVDDDTTDDDSADDDVYLDDRCERPLDCLSKNACRRVLCQYYCMLQTPLIVDGEQFGQRAAVAECRAATPGLWADIADCVNRGAELAQCLQDRGWPADYPDLFAADSWSPIGLGEVLDHAEALNLLYFETSPNPLAMAALYGAVIDPTADRLHFTEISSENDPAGANTEVFARGDNVSTTPTQIDFAVSGWTIWSAVGGGYRIDPYTNTLTFVAVER